MSETVRREMVVPQRRELVWRAITEPSTLAAWLYPNDFVARVGHRFTFQVPGNPKVGFDGLTVSCAVLVCDPPSELVFTWSVPGPVAETQVSFRLEAEGAGTRIYFEHSGFDLSQPRGKQALKGAEFGWAKMLEQLAAVLEREAGGGQGA